MGMLAMRKIHKARKGEDYRDEIELEVTEEGTDNIPDELEEVEINEFED